MHVMKVCCAHHIAAHSQGQGKFFYSNCVTLKLTKVCVQTISSLSIGQYLYNFKCSLTIARMCIGKYYNKYRISTEKAYPYIVLMVYVLNAFNRQSFCLAHSVQDDLKLTDK